MSSTSPSFQRREAHRAARLIVRRHEERERLLPVLGRRRDDGGPLLSVKPATACLLLVAVLLVENRHRGLECGQRSAILRRLVKRAKDVVDVAGIETGMFGGDRMGASPSRLALQEP